ncbi:hypothetical protein EIP91_000759 [Steccherinum ochraceum]|uniref:Metallo-beta-lactamase domain-containing protein n=1 Tax=Steccherinum ochraceum TaxID=92696 RepID=A0A4R0RF65_9APHY|nr:hypothetical protein EIP91_000759 [Steccherinum ochraceum]
MSSSTDRFAPTQKFVVSPPESNEKPSTRPAHHANSTQTRYPSVSDWTKYFAGIFVGYSIPPVPMNIASLIPTQQPDWGVDLSREEMKATWLGHACFLVELPAPRDAVRGARIIFDPVFQDSRCSPVQFKGPQRFTPAPCDLHEIPAVDAIVLSHNHYDHTDTPTIQYLVQQHNAHVFAPLGNKPYLSSIGVPTSNIHTLDWWEDCTVTISVSSSSTSSSTLTVTDVQFKLTCTPAQHTANRTLLDRWTTLWASWTLEDLTCPGGKNAYFAGDTGYRTVRKGEDPESVPTCPAFKEIGEKLGPFDLAMIPIGAYDPRALFSGVHAHPADSVRIFKDVRAKKALAMHWGTWILTSEPIMEPPTELRRECDKAHITQEEFDICALGETRAF